MNTAGSADRCSSCAPCAVPLSIALRIALGGLFIFSGLMKLGIFTLGGTLKTADPQMFAFAIRKFDLGLSDGMTSFLAFAIPWTELIAGLAILLGLLTRGAAAIIGLMMIAFLIGIISVLARGMEIECSCFGTIKLLCTGNLGTCHIVRNLVLLAMAAALVWMGPGPLSLDRSILRRD